MAAVLYKEKDRFFISFIIALLVHIIVLTGLHFLLNISIEPDPEYTGPLYLKIRSEFRQEAVVEDTEDNGETLDKADERETAGNGRRDETVTDEQRDDDNASALVRRDETGEKDPVSEERETEETVVDDGREADVRDASENTEDSTGNNDNRDRDDKNGIEKTPMLTPEPTLTPTPYDPAIEEDNLALLDKLLEDGTSDGSGPGDDDAVTGDSDSQGNNTPRGEDGGPVIEWEDNRDRTPLKTYEPDLPDWVSTEGRELQVDVTFLLSPDGFLRSLRVVRSSGYTDVDNSIVDALRKWKFSSVSGTESVSGRVTYFIGLK